MLAYFRRVKVIVCTYMGPQELAQPRTEKLGEERPANRNLVLGISLPPPPFPTRQQQTS